MVGERNGAYDARFPDFAFPDDTRASRVRIADTHHVHARNSTGNQMLAGPSRAICLCGRRVNAEATRSDAELLPWLVRRTRATHQLFGARPIKRSLYDSAMWARRSASTNDGNQRGILRFHARESRSGLLRPTDSIYRRSRFPVHAGEICDFQPGTLNNYRSRVFKTDVTRFRVARI